MTNDNSFDIAIVGGGLAGASLALLLSDRLPAIRIALLEALPLQASTQPPAAPSYDDRSSALSLGSCRILQSISSQTLWGKMQPCLTPIRQVHVSDRGHPAGTVMNGNKKELANDVLGYVIENRSFGQILLQQLAQAKQITLMSPVRVDKITVDAKRAYLQLTQNPGEFIQAALVVIADGAESTLREQLGITVDQTSYNQTAVIANITTSGFHDHVAYERFTDSGPMALLPLQDFENEHRCALVWTINESYAETVKNMSDEVFLQQIQQRFGNRLGFFTKTGKRSLYPLTLHKAREQIRRHIVLMGNAAHGMHPVAGQGFNLSLRDCLALTETLLQAYTKHQAYGDLSVLMNYIQRQEWDQEKTIGASHLLTLLFSTPDSTAAFARNTGLLGLNFLPGIKNWFARHAMGITGK